LEGAGRRWFFFHVGTATAIGLVLAEVFWHYHELPRRARRDEYYRRLGVDWVHLG